MQSKNVEGIEMNDALKKLYFNALNVPKDMVPWGGIMYGFRVRKRVMHLDAEMLEHNLTLICDKACDATEIGIIKELAQSWIDYVLIAQRFVMTLLKIMAHQGKHLFTE